MQASRVHAGITGTRVDMPYSPEVCILSMFGSKLTTRIIAYSAFVDVLLAGLAWHITWKLRISRKEKVGVAICMSLGIL